MLPSLWLCLIVLGPGEINWHSLITVFSSEMLKFEEEQRQLEEATKALALERPHTPPSRKGSGNTDQLSSPRGEPPSQGAVAIVKIYALRCLVSTICKVFLYVRSDTTTALRCFKPLF